MIFVLLLWSCCCYRGFGASSGVGAAAVILELLMWPLS
jgi:hypothetical protein